VGYLGWDRTSIGLAVVAQRRSMKKTGAGAIDRGACFGTLPLCIRRGPQVNSQNMEDDW
jgi:hypothetical protein